MATISDVARLAGVSTMTVSRVLNQTGNVSPQKREAVLKAIAALNYQPNLLARSLATSRSGTIGLIVTVMGNPIYPAYMEGASERLRRAGLDVIVYYADSFQTVQIGVYTLLSKQVDGLIILPLEIHEGREARAQFGRQFQDAVARSGKPTVFIGNRDLRPFASVVEDYAAGAALAVEYLFGMGHRDIGYLQADLEGYPWTERTAGFRRGMRDRGLRVRTAWCPRIPEGFENILQAVRDWVRTQNEAKHGLPGAVYCANDLIALATLYAFGAEGLRVPEDISIIGHDGIIYTAYSYPKITTVALLPRQTGQAAAQMLLEQMAGKADRGCRMMQHALQEGQTVRRMEGAEAYGGESGS